MEKRWSTGAEKVLTVLIISVIVVNSAQIHPGDPCIDFKGHEGVCTVLNQCPRAQWDLRKGVVPTNCSFDRDQPIVCCVAGSRTSASPPLPLSGAPANEKIPGERAKKWCEKYSRLCTQRYGITGGNFALPDEFPHMVAIGYGLQNDIKWKCGGSLISEKFVLTAAHCLLDGEYGLPQWVLLGSVTLVANESFLDNEGQIHTVVQRISHPEYEPPMKYNDIALLEIGSAVTRNPRSLTTIGLHPACLRTDDSIKYDTYIKSSWGQAGLVEGYSVDLLRRELHVLNESRCNAIYGPDSKYLSKGIDSRMMCAEILGDGSDICQGDSGAPLQVSKIGTCQYEILGITTFGRFCIFPSVYTKVSAYIGWIEDNIWPE